jgi:transcriptional regulator with XRE-family HTH domain
MKLDPKRLISGAQLRASRRLLSIDQNRLADLCGLSLATIHHMEASDDGVIRGNIDSLMKVVAALDAAGVEFISENEISNSGGRGVRLKVSAPR